MLYIQDDGTIRLTRGDTARLSVEIINEFTKQPYAVLPGDEMVLTVKKTVKEGAPRIQKKIIGSASFKIDPEDTENLAFGSYKYDVQLTTEDGDVYTVIGPATFEILTEVTY